MKWQETETRDDVGMTHADTERKKKHVKTIMMMMAVMITIWGREELPVDLRLTLR